MKMPSALHVRAAVRSVCRSHSVVVALLLSGLVPACQKTASAPAPQLKELQRASSGAIDIVLLSEGDTLKSGMGKAYLEFRSGSDRHLTDVGTVKVRATMPMPGYRPMQGSMFVHRSDVAGRYSIDTDLGMIGTWQIGVQWEGPAGAGMVTLPGTVQ